MAKTLIVTLTDDLDGGTADETIVFSLEGHSYEIDLNHSNAEKLRQSLAPFIEKAASTGRSNRSNKSRPEQASGSPTAFSKLTDEEKGRFRAWAKAPNARRIADAKVQEWERAGKP